MYGSLTDCSPVVNGFRRTLCDLHCVRDAVKKGNTAILHSLASAVETLQENTDLLMEYYTGTVMNSVDAVKESVEGSKKSMLMEQVRMEKKRLLAMFGEMSDVVRSSNLPAAGEMTAAR